MDNGITGEIENILGTSVTSVELAEAYLRDRPQPGAEPDGREEIARELSGLDDITAHPGLVHGIVDAYYFFSAPILFEGGYFSNNRIDDLLLSPEQMAGRLDDGMAACELVGNAPLLVDAKTVVAAKNNLSYLTREPCYLECAQLTGLQMLCLDVPEALDEVVRVMGERPFIRSSHGEDKPYLRAFIRVLGVLITEAAQGGAVIARPSDELIAGVISAFYHEYLSFPAEGYLTDLVKSTIPG